MPTKILETSAPQTHLCVHQLFDQVAVSERADHIAVRHHDQQLSYVQLNGRANYLAGVLVDKGVKQGDVVALYLSRSVEMLVAMLAVLKAGAAYLPLETNHPTTHKLSYLDEANVSIIISSYACDDLLGNDRQLIRGEDDTLFRGYAETPPRTTCTPDSLAYIMFTSGSTGRPKGVLVPHRGITRLVINSSFIDIRNDDIFLQFSPTSFDASTFEIWAPLLNGATLVLYQGEVFDPNLFKADIVDKQVTVLWLTAALFHLIAERFIDAFKPLRVILAGGDVLNVNYCNKVLDSVEGITLINGYGPTENTTFTCCHRMSAENRPVKHVPIGLPISGTQVLVLDESMHRVPQGQVGELVAAGDGIALGYLNDPDNASFVVAVDIAPGVLYKTGDLVRMGANGEFEFVGRKDNLVKVRGYRVSLEEIRLGLMELDGVRDVSVALEGQQSNQLLVAKLSVVEGFSYSIAAVRNAMSEHFPTYMIPDRITIADQLPINHNGKIETKKTVYS